MLPWLDLACIIKYKNVDVGTATAVAQLVEQHMRNAVSVGSAPSGGKLFFHMLSLLFSLLFLHFN